MNAGRVWAGGQVGWTALVMVDQGSGAEIMYPDLYKGLSLRPEDLTAYNSPLVSFDGKVVIPRGMIRLPMQASS